MSENGEHSPDDTEAETKAMEDLPNDSSKSEKLMMDRTDAALLEDEEMPTYISVSSISRRDDSLDIVGAKQQENASMEEERTPSPSPSDDQTASSVCVLSSEGENDHLPYNDEDDEDEYGDSDDMENMEQLDNNLDSEHRNNMKHLMDEDDDDDDEDEDDEENSRGMHNDEEDDDDEDDIDEYYDRVSADIVLNKALKKQDKEKSCSLQDLSVYRNNMYTDFNKRRHSTFVRQSIPQNIIMFPVARRKQYVPEKYHYVQSKVKLYIKDIKDQNRRSMEKHQKDHEDAIHNKNNTDCKNSDTEEMKSIATNRTIKSYAEKTIKELERAEACEKNRQSYNASPILLNGQDNKNGLEAIKEKDMPAQDDVEMNTLSESKQDKEEESTINIGDKKQNGVVEVDFPEGEIRQFGSAMQSTFIQNGHQEVPPVFFNLHTLSYEEYMRGPTEPNKKTDLNQNARVSEEERIRSEPYKKLEPMDVSDTDNNDIIYSMKIEDIKSIDIMDHEVKCNNEQVTFNKENEEFNKTTSDNTEVATLKDQLNQKTVQYNNLRDTYQKQLAENLKMKQELEELRKSIAKYEKGNKRPEQKVACIQTDFINNTNETKPLIKVTNENNSQVEPANVKQRNNKISGSSVASSLSSVEQWTDSVCSLSVSMKPPEPVKMLHSDDSLVLTDSTPKKNTRSLSHAFITSSRILQTLSNITQGKAKPESPLVQNSKKRLNENSVLELQNDDASCQNRPSSSKKRKIADVLGPFSFLQTVKSQIDADTSHVKLNETANTEFQFKYPCDSINERSESQDNSSAINTGQLAATTSRENKTESVNESEDNVKCFVYHENENSKDRSFLIQAEEPTKDKLISEKGRMRECGPFLLGNVELRMSEINGTINIWGKEINDESTVENDNEMETSTKVKNDKKCWQKTRFNGSNIVCSSSKKSKIPAKLELSSAGSNISCPHSMSFNNTSKPFCSTDKGHTDSVCSPGLCVSSCEEYDASKLRKEWLKYKRIQPEEKLHSCCNHSVDVLGQKGNCSLHKEKPKTEDNCNCNKEKLTPKEHRRSFSRNLEANKHVHENIINLTAEDNELTCGYHTTCHHTSHEPGEHYSENHAHCGTLREASSCEQLKTNASQGCNGMCSYTNIDEEEPLIAFKQCNETPETRRRRLSGKRVRTILMDFLRGCGDCYNPNTPSTSKGCLHKKEIPYSSCSPRIKISPCVSSEASCSNAGQFNGRCCHAYAQRIESQLEEFRVEMEKVRSRSDAILDMLNMLHSVDTN